MKPWQIVLIPAAALAGLLGLWGYLAWHDRHGNSGDALYASALKSFKEGQAAVEQKNKEAAKRSFSSADQNLQEMLKQNDPANKGPALVLRFRTLMELKIIAKDVEKAGVVLPPGQRSSSYFAEAGRMAERAAEDPANAQAQAAVIQWYMEKDWYDQAVPYAVNLVRHLPEKSDDDFDLHPRIMGAYFILARAAMRRTPPQLDEAIDYIRQSDELQAKWLVGRPPSAGQRETGWRYVGLYAQALAMKAAFASAPPTAQQEMTEKFAQWMERARNEAQPIANGPSVVAKLSESNLRGLYDFLTLALQKANSAPEVLDRLHLLVFVWHSTVNVNPPDEPTSQALRIATAQFAKWPQLIGKIPNALQPQPSDWPDLFAGMERTAARLLDAGAVVDHSIMLEISRVAQSAGQFDAAGRFIELGLKAAGLQRLKPDSSAVLDLRLAAAWSYLTQKNAAELDAPTQKNTAEIEKTIQKNAAELEKQRALLRQSESKADPAFHVIEAVAALQDGQLEKGLAELYQSRYQSAASAAELLVQTYANAALGRFEPALADLERLDRYYEKNQTLPPEQQILAKRFGLDHTGVVFELFRCQLALGQVEPALRTRERLRGEPEWLTAGIILVRHYLGLGPTAAERPSYTYRPPTQSAVEAARRELVELQKAAPRDGRLLVIEAEMLERDPGVTPEEARRRAEDFLTHAAGKWQGDADDAQLIRAAWLVRHHRLDEVIVKLEDSLAKLSTSSPMRSRLGLLRNLAVAGRSGSWDVRGVPNGPGPGSRLGPLLAELTGDPGAIDLYLASGPSGPGRHETAAWRHFWRGVNEQARENWEAAAASFGNAMADADLRTVARRHYLTCVLRLLWEKDPTAAYVLARQQLDATYRAPRRTSAGNEAEAFDPVALIAYIETCLFTDSIADNKGVEGAIQGLRAVVRGQLADPAAVATYEAEVWLGANRPDRARIAVQEALRFHPTHLPTLQICERIDKANADWPALLQHGETLAKALPDKPDGLVWKTEALIELGDAKAAEKACAELTNRFPSLPEGYRLSVLLRERKRDYSAALVEMDRWKARVPADLVRLRMEVRLLSRTGKGAEAGAAAERALGAFSGKEIEVCLAAAYGSFEAGSHAAAQSWAQRAVDAATRLGRREPLLQAHCLLGDINRSLGASTSNEGDRTRYVDQAIAEYRLVFKDEPHHADAACRLAELLTMQRGEADTGFEVLQRYRETRTGGLLTGDRLSLDVLEVAGPVFQAAHRYREALTLFSQAEQRYRREPAVLYHLGRAYVALKQYPEAAAKLRQAADLAAEKAVAARDQQDRERWQDLSRTARQAEQDLRH